MVKTLKKHGNSHALVLEKPLMDAIGVSSETPLQVTVSGNSLIITPVNVGLGEDAVKSALARLRPQYGEMLKNLAK